MLQGIRELVALIFIGCGTQLFCMQQSLLNNQIKIIEGDDQVIYVMERTIKEILGDEFQYLITLVQAGEFSEAKNCLEDYCRNIAEDLEIQNHEMFYSIDYLRELLTVFKLKSKEFLKELNNDFNAVTLGCHETLRCLGLLLALCLGIAGIVFFDSGTFLTAIAMTLIVCFDTKSFFATGSIVSIIATIHQPDLFSYLIILVSITSLSCLMHIHNKRKEKNEEVKSVKKIIHNFEKILEEYIDLPRHNFELKELLNADKALGL